MSFGVMFKSELVFPLGKAVCASRKSFVNILPESGFFRIYSVFVPYAFRI